VRKSRILPLLGPAAALYLVADAASTLGELHRMQWAIAIAGILLTLAPLLLRRRIGAEAPGARRVGMLGVTFGVGLCAGLSPFGQSLASDLAYALSAAAAGAIVLDLAVGVPDRLPPFRRARPLLVLGAIAATAMGGAASLPAFELFGEPMVAPPRFLYAPALYGTGCAALGLLIRIARRRWGSTPEALASNAWAVLGIAPLVAACATALGLTAEGETRWSLPLVAAGGVVTLYGHTALVDATRRLQAGHAVRRAVAAGFTLALAGTAVVFAHPQLPRDPYALAVLTVAALSTSALVWRGAQVMAHRLLAPYGGRLLDALDRARAELGRVSSVDELAESVLGPLRDATGDTSAMPLLLTFDPPREARIDAARQPHVRRIVAPPSLVRRLDAEPGQLVEARSVHAQVVRRPDVRELSELLASWEALCVVPLGVGDQTEGALVLARGRRGTSLSLEEMNGLRTLADEVTARLALLGTRDRASARVAELAAARDRMEERVEEQGEELRRLRTDAQVLSAGRAESRAAAPPIAYSPAMREAVSRLGALAPLETSVLLVAEGGTPVDRIARMLHAKSGRSDGPFVVADAASVSTEEAEAILFGRDGDAPRPGWMRLARGGTLLLADVPALGTEAQRALAEALAVKQARAIGGAAYPVDVRVIATSRVPVEELAEAGLFDPELARWFGNATVEVPPLRKRSEDLPSLVLLALDRACRVHGKPPMGIAEEAIERLLEHGWPGNLRELQHVIDRAVAKAESDTVLAKDLPALARPKTPDPLDGTYAEMERHLLVRAMKRAGGNKSEAARILGLKRTTFLDKLRRQGIEDPKPSKRSAESARH